jgi:hypothetical protein
MCAQFATDFDDDGPSLPSLNTDDDQFFCDDNDFDDFDDDVDFDTFDGGKFDSLPISSLFQYQCLSLYLQTLFPKKNPKTVRTTMHLHQC